MYAGAVEKVRHQVRVRTGGLAQLRYDIKKDLGEFPFPGFWGPAAGVDSPQFKADVVSRWIAESAKWIERRHVLRRDSWHQLEMDGWEAP